MSSTVRSAVTVNVSNFASFVDAGLRRYQNVEYTSANITLRQAFEAKHNSNLLKQARQIGYCIALAREYSAAALAATLATKPVLLYYSVLNYALAEILIKQNGDSSLDKAREKNSHHGLEIAFDSGLLKCSNLDVLDFLRARPHEKSGNRSGTFELWHRSAREHPAIGKITAADQSTQYGAVLLAVDDSLPPVLSKGLTLRQVLQLIPTMSSQISRFQINSAYCRSTLSMNIFDEGSQLIRLIVHPDSTKKLENLSSKFLFQPACVPDVEVVEFKSGFILSIKLQKDAQYSFNMPMMSSVSKDDIRICSIDSSINEFGAFYFALFILGNLSRYYPDVWIRHIEENSDLTNLVETLCDEFYRRVPVLVLAELDRVLTLPH